VIAGNSFELSTLQILPWARHPSDRFSAIAFKSQTVVVSGVVTVHWYGQLLPTLINMTADSLTVLVY